MKYLALLLFFYAVMSPAALADQTLTKLTLQKALQMAVENHPLLAGGKAGIEIQQGLEKQARAPGLPQISYSATYSRANSRGSVFGASEAFTNYTSNFSLNQLITDFGKTPELIRASHEQVMASKETLQYNLQQVLLSVYQAYYQHLQAKANLKVQEDNVENLQDHLSQAKTFFEVGTQPKIDVTQAQVNLSNGDLSLVQAQNTFEISKTNLKTAMGVPDFSLFEVEEDLQEPPALSISLVEAVNNAFQFRPDLLALMAQQLGIEASLNAVQRSYFPTLTASAGSGQIGSTFYPNNNTWNLGVQLNFSIFNGLLTTGQVEQEKGILHQVAAQVDNLKLTIRQAAEQAYDNLISAKSSLKVAKDSLNYAKENYELANGRYRTGVGNYLQYTDAQVSYVQAQSNLIAALANYNIAIASLKQATGILTLEGR